VSFCRRNEKAGSPTPERGVTPTTEKEVEDLRKAEALLKERGLLSTPYFDENPVGKRQRTKSALSGRESEESVPQESYASAASRKDDIDVIQAVGWEQPGFNVGAASTAGAGGPPAEQGMYRRGFDYSAVGGVGAMDPTAPPPQNPFFAGAAVAGPQGGGFAPGSKPQGGNQQQNQQRSSKNKSYRPRQNRNRQERPDKKDGGRTQSYRKR